MTAPVLAFFNNKGGVGKTSLVYDLAWTFSDMGKVVVVFDLDPQTNLTTAFLEEEHIEELCGRTDAGTTIYNCVKPLQEMGDIVTGTSAGGGKYISAAR